MRFEVVTLFPEMVTTVAEFGVVGRAQRKGLMELGCENPRDHTHDVHRTVDDRPYGGGPGMVMAVEPLRSAIRAARDAAVAGTRVGLMSPQGRPIDQRALRELAARYPALDYIAVHAQHPAERAAGLELIDQYPDRDTGRAAVAVGRIGDILAAAKAAFEQIVDKRGRPSAGQVSEQLPLLFARQQSCC